MIELEFSRPVMVDKLGPAEKVFEIEAKPDERKALAERFGIIEVGSLKAVIRLKLISGGPMVRLRGRFEADVIQTCVVTLEPVPAHLEEEFELTYGPEAEQDEEEIVIDLEIVDPPELIEGGAIDIGEAAAEHLALALDPFPRAPGATFDSPAEETEVEDSAPVEDAEKPNPFAALAALKKK